MHATLEKLHNWLSEIAGQVKLVLLVLLVFTLVSAPFGFDLHKGIAANKNVLKSLTIGRYFLPISNRHQIKNVWSSEKYCFWKIILSVVAVTKEKWQSQKDYCHFIL